MDKKNSDNRNEQFSPSNEDLEGNDKFPGEEKGKGELIANDDLKGKKVDGDPEEKSDQPAR
jgi:hypothetical protein